MKNITLYHRYCPDEFIFNLFCVSSDGLFVPDNEHCRLCTRTDSLLIIHSDNKNDFFP